MQCASVRSACAVLMFLSTGLSLGMAEVGSCKDGEASAHKRRYSPDITECATNCEAWQGECVESRRYVYLLFGIRLAESGRACYCSRNWYYIPRKESNPFPDAVLGSVLKDPGLESISELSRELADELGVPADGGYAISVSRRCTRKEYSSSDIDSAVELMLD